MKILKTFILFIFVLAFFRIDLYSTIYSRVEGVLKDKETGGVIEEANVYLFIGRTKQYETQTDSKGVFAFKKVDPEKEYYVVGEKKGYIPNVSEFRRYEGLKHLSRIEFRKFTEGFYLKSGEIKYVTIELERGGSIKGKILQKDSTGIKPSHSEWVILKKEKEPVDNIPDKAFVDDEIALYYSHSDKNGYYEIDGLKPSNKYFLQIEREGFTTKYFENIEVKRNDVTVIDFTFDLESKTGIKGIVRKDGVAVEGGFVLVFRFSDNKRIAKYSLRGNNGKYNIIMLEPGLYKVEYSYIENKIRTAKAVTIKIDKNEIKTINIDF